MNANKFIAALDIGTTTIRCYIFDHQANIAGSAFDTIQLIYPEPGHVEIDADKLFESVVKTISNAIADAKLTANDVACLAIATQRSSFITWDRKTGEKFHNLITWNDLRANELCNKINKGIKVKAMNGVSKILYTVTRSNRFQLGSVFRLMNTMVLPRLLYVIKHNTVLKAAIKNQTALFGTLDCWLLYKLRQGKDTFKVVEHITDISNATATGFFDPFTLEWADWAKQLFKVNESILPKVVDNSYDFGVVDKSIFGSEIVIGTSISDQSASMWGSCCFKRTDLKITLGTGTFLNINTGNKCPGSKTGLYPIVAWQVRDNIQDDLTFAIEGGANDTGTLINWAMTIGLFTDPAESSVMANSVDSSEGVYFIPAFSGLGQGKSVYWRKRILLCCSKQAPNYDDEAATGFIGVKPSTRKPHLVRSLLESIAFRAMQIYVLAARDTNYKFTTMRIDGGVSKNDFICQLLADLTQMEVERAVSTDMTALGACYLAGLNIAFWNTKNDLVRMRKIEKVFKPRPELQLALLKLMYSWERAVDRFRKWYDPREIALLRKMQVSSTLG